MRFVYAKSGVLLLWAVLAFLNGCSSDGVGQDPDSCCTAKTYNVDVRWTIAGGTCAERPFIKKIGIELFDYNTAKKSTFTVPCSLNGIDGTTLKAIPDGKYSITIDAQTESGLQVPFSSRYHNDNTFDETRTPLVVELIDGFNPPRNVFFTYLFPSLPNNPTPNCSQTGVEKVNVWFDPPVANPPPQIILNEECIIGQVGNVYGAQVSPGTWILTIKSVTPVGQPSYSYRGQVTVPPSGMLYSTIQLQKN